MAPAFGGCTVQSNGASRTHLFRRCRRHGSPQVLHHIRAPLPDPLQPGNSEDFGTACRLGKDLQNAVVSNKARCCAASRPPSSRTPRHPATLFMIAPLLTQGWAPEDLNGKFGLISEYAGAELVLDVGAVAKSLTVSFTRGPDPYFGDAEVSCEGGCACEPERIASFFAENQVRTMRQFFLQFKEPAPGCHLRFVAGQARVDAFAPLVALSVWSCCADRATRKKIWLQPQRARARRF